MIDELPSPSVVPSPERREELNSNSELDGSKLVRFERALPAIVAERRIDYETFSEYVTSRSERQRVAEQ